MQISYADMLRKVEPLRNELDLVGKEKDLNQGKVIGLFQIFISPSPSQSQFVSVTFFLKLLLC